MAGGEDLAFFPARPALGAVGPCVRRLRSSQSLRSAPDSAPCPRVRPPSAGRSLFYALTLCLACALANPPPSSLPSPSGTASLFVSLSLSLWVVSKAGEWTGESATARRSFEDSLSSGQSWQACPPAPFEAAPGSESISGGGGSGCAPAGTAGGPAPGPGPRPCNRDGPGSGPLPPHWLFSIRAPGSQPPPGARSRG